MHDKYGNGYSGVRRFLNTISSICVVLFGICGPSETQATILYVDKDSPCPGAGTTGVPYCSIQNAFNMVNPGDTIRIRNAASPYDQNAKTTRSGTASSPIVLEPDIGNTPIIRYTGGGSQRAAIEIRDADYWIVRNL